MSMPSLVGFWPSSKNKFLLTVGASFMDRFCYLCFVLSVHCSFVVSCWERTGHLALFYVMFYCVFVTFLCCVLGQVCYLIVSIPDLCLLTYFL